jgi:hypothetical protein
MNKKNMYRFLFSALFAFALSPAFSQFSAGLNLGFPSGNWSSYESTGFGVDVRYEAPIQDKLNWDASIGFLTFSGKSYGGGNYNSITGIPVVGGLKYYFQQSNSGVYGGVDVGLVFWSGGGSSENRFVFAPGVGYRIPKFDFSFRYNAMSDFNLVGLRAAYIFPGK